MSVSRVMVTGASGFVGEAVVYRLLLDRRHTPIAASRGRTRLDGLCQVVPFELGGVVTMPSLIGVEVVVHAAARVHVMNDQADDVLAEFRRINVDGTVSLARSAAAAGVKRFIFISSIKVNGESTEPGKPFRADLKPQPMDPYGVSKMEAELALKDVAKETGIEVVIVRPPLVYGPGVKANFLSMMRWLDRGVVLPFGAIGNRRSLVAIGNLVDLLVTCIDHPAAAGHTFLVSDDSDMSTTQLLDNMATALGKKARLLPLPVWLLKTVASSFGKQSVAQRLCASLQVDISKTRQVLGWFPPVSVGKALRQTAGYYQDLKNK